MNRIILITILVLIVPALLSAQINWTEHTIAANFDYARSVFAIDLDDDGDVDVLGAAEFADDITWWENDGSENFTVHTIDANFNGARSVFAIDLDDDNDVDVLGAAVDADDITWWESDLAPGVTERNLVMPKTFRFNASTINKSRTSIEFSLPVATGVDLLIYDVTGRLSETLISQRFSAGNHILNINLELTVGIYFYNLKTTSGEHAIKKFLLIE